MNAGKEVTKNSFEKNRWRDFLGFLLHPGKTLTQKAVLSGVWIVIYKFFERSIRFIKIIIIARLIAPSDFGLLGISYLALDTLQTFTETGFGSALVQKKGRIEEYLNVAWTVELAKGIVLFSILYLSAPVIATFFQSPQSAPLMRVIALIFVISGLANIGTIHFTRELELGKQRMIQACRLVKEFVVSISLAFILRNAWALVWGMLLGRVAQSVASYVFHPYRPKISFDLSKARELMHFGKWIFALSVLAYFCTRGDDIFVGKLLGVSALGLYIMAYTISNMAPTEVTFLLSQLMFPAYAKIQSDRVRLKEVYSKSLTFVNFISFPLTACLVFFAADFTKFFLGEKWLGMVPAMQILAFSGLIRSVTATGGSLCKGLGRPYLDFQMNFVKLAVLLFTIYPLCVRFGLKGAAVSALLSTLASVPLWARNVFNLIKFGWRDYWRALFPSFFATLLLSISYILFKTLFFRESTLFNFFSLAGLVLGVYLMTIFLFWKFKRVGPMELLKTVSQACRQT